MLGGKELYLLLGMVVLSCFFVFWDFLSFEKVYFLKDIGSDSLNIYYPSLMHMSDYIKAWGVPTWSFSQGLGQNTFPSGWAISLPISLWSFSAKNHCLIHCLCGGDKDIALLLCIL